MRALLDVNVLIALLDSDHLSHVAALRWFTEHAQEGWASCPITQNGCIRVMSSAAYPNRLPISAIAERLAEACRRDVHEFWPDAVSLLDPEVVDTSRIHGPRQLTDCYLLALAVRHAGRLVTFDASITPVAVRRATRKQLLVL